MDLSEMQQHGKWLVRGMWTGAILGFVFEHFDLGKMAAGAFVLLLFSAGPYLLILRYRIRCEKARLPLDVSPPSAEGGLLRTSAVVLSLGLTDVLFSGLPLFSIFVCAAGLLYLFEMLAARKNRSLAILRAKKAMITLMVGSIAIAASAYDAAQMEPRAAALADALRQFKIRHGHYPAKLQELVP